VNLVTKGLILVKKIRINIKMLIYKFQMMIYFICHISMLQSKTLQIVELLLKYSKGQYRFKKAIIKNIMEMQEMCIDPDERIGALKYFKIQEFHITYIYFLNKIDVHAHGILKKDIDQITNILKDVYLGMGINEYLTEYEVSQIIKKNRK